MNILKWHGLDIDPKKIHESITTEAVLGQIETAFNESTNESGITVLYPRIEAIHAGRTRNFNRYLAEKLKGDFELKSGVYSWTAPYPKPVIHNHDINTEATGRVYSATYSDITQAGRPGIIVTPKITQDKAIKDIMEGRLLTVSIGASTDAAICSACGTDIINEGFCGHMRGEEHEGEMVEWIAGNLWFDELSWVNVPADSDAMIIGNNSLSNNGLTTEQLVVKNISESNAKEEKEGMAQEENTIVTEATEESTETVVEENATQETEETKETVLETEQVEESTETENEDAQVEVTNKEETQVEEQEVEEVDTKVQEELESVKTELTEAQQTIEELTAANEALAKELTETVTGFLVDLRIALGKESNREEAVEKFAARSVESLRDSISDLLAENPVIQPSGTARTIEHVEMPAGEKVVVESKQLATTEEKVTSNEDALIRLLTGRR